MANFVASRMEIEEIGEYVVLARLIRAVVPPPGRLMLEDEPLRQMYAIFTVPSTISLTRQAKTRCCGSLLMGETIEF